MTDIGGLNDGLQPLAYKGLKRAQKQLGVTGRVFISKSAARLHPEPARRCAPGGLRPRDRRRLPDGRRDRHAVAKQFPNTKFAIIDFPCVAASRASRRTSAASSSRSRRRLPRRRRWPRRSAKSEARSRRVGGHQDPAGRRFIAGYKAGAKKANPSIEGRSTATRRTSSTRPSARSSRSNQIDAGLRRRLPGRRRLRPRRPRRGEGEGRLGHRRRRRPGVPRPAHPDERARRGSTWPCSRRSSWRQGRQVQGRRRRRLQPSRTAASASARSARRRPKRAALIAKLNAARSRSRAGKIKPPIK